MVPVSVWGRQAEVAGRYLTRGQRVFVEGRLETSEWQDNAGEKRISLDVRCDNFQMLGSRDEMGGGGGGARPAGGSGGPSAPAGGSDFGPDDDDIPF